MNLAVASQELDDTECEYAQDILFNKIGTLYMRGPVQAISAVATTPKPATGLVQTLDPNGTSRFAVLYGDTGSSVFGALDSGLATITALGWNGTLPTGPPSNPYYIVDSKSALNGGSWVGTSSQYDANAPVQSLALWKGGNKADYSTGTISVTRGGTVVTGAGTTWTGNVVAGEFLFATTDDGYTLTFVGTVQSVDSSTQITLVDPSPYPATAKAYKCTSLRGFCPRVGVGKITCSTGSATVNGGATKFSTQKLNTNTWNIYKAADWTWVGKVSAVTSDIQLTLAANAAVAMNNEAYIALQADGDWSINSQAVANKKMGFLNATYAGRQWYANLGQKFAYTTTVWFSDPNDPEVVDLSTYNGNFLPIGSSTGANTPIKAIMPSFNALLVIKDNETYGIYGTSPSNFSPKKIEDDGTLGGMSVQSYGGGVVWAGRNGIYFYDGVKSNNLTKDKLGAYYKNAIKSFDPTKYRLWSMLIRNHYFLFLESVAPTYAVVKGSVSVTPTRYCITVDLDSGAVSTHTNVNLRGSIVLPASTGQTTWYIVNNTTTGFICDAGTLFDSTGRDAITCDGGTAGPDPYWVSKKYKAGDSLRKKLFKQIAAEYLAAGGALKLDTVVGLNNVGATSLTQFPATVYTWDQLPAVAVNWDTLASLYPTWDQIVQSVFKPKRIKFLKRTQHLAFRIYAADTNLTQMVIGPFQLGYKLQSIGRI
jgi:hypothetical protein